jgi:hypothetical protein
MVIFHPTHRKDSFISSQEISKRLPGGHLLSDDNGEFLHQTHRVYSTQFLLRHLSALQSKGLWIVVDEPTWLYSPQRRYEVCMVSSLNHLQIRAERATRFDYSPHLRELQPVTHYHFHIFSKLTISRQFDDV